ncbi:trypsin-7-like [Plodia interpunctella]|uniref:trypsin-7-like n=1 Tax=Plodia interpunctella TaxID=58824 RepID=UPI0023686495|nr:trypsin-7-like [Plodia interpunctella]
MYCIQALAILYLSFYRSPVAIESRVFDGEDLRFDVHRYLVKLKAHHQLNQHSRCSGSIINNNWILTSAHCFALDIENVTVYHQVEDAVRVIAKVDKHNVIRHPRYKVGDISIENRRYDIALLKTALSIKFSDFVQPVKLSERDPREYQSGIIAGYGDAEENLPVPREGFVVLRSCPYRVDGLLCTVDTVRAGAGDSGGSLLSRGRLAGVTSASCKDVYVHKPCITVYTSVSTHLKWINKVCE